MRKSKWTLYCFCQSAYNVYRFIFRKGMFAVLKTGIVGKAEVQVAAEHTARVMKSGELEVFATPAMVALAEEAACRSVAPYLNEGETTVGTLVQLEHLAATPVGMLVSAESRLIELDGRRLVFEICVRDQRGEVGRGRHERFIVRSDRFLKKAQERNAAG